MTATVFKNARMVLPGEVVLGSLQVDGGRIASLDSGGTAALQGIDLGGRLPAARAGGNTHR